MLPSSDTPQFGAHVRHETHALKYDKAADEVMAAAKAHNEAVRKGAKDTEAGDVLPDPLHSRVDLGSKSYYEASMLATLVLLRHRLGSLHHASHARVLHRVTHNTHTSCTCVADAA